VRRETIYLGIIAQSNLCGGSDVELGLGKDGYRWVTRWRHRAGCTSMPEVLFITRENDCHLSQKWRVVAWFGPLHSSLSESESESELRCD
jgi:hypothetical protein